jgi:16S rRNA (uracil1498-N3)-methyltransferase
MNLFYTPDILSGSFFLNEEESKHSIRVLRLKEGDLLQLVDGEGSFYTARITEANPKKCHFEIIDKKEAAKKNFHLHIAVAPTKNIDRMEWFLEKSVEIGIDEISFLQCEKSERTVVKTERLHKIAVSAMKQSVKAYLPEINEMIRFKDFMEKREADQKFIAHCSATMNNRVGLKSALSKAKDVLILIGPEGDFSEKEINFAVQKGYQPVTLGESRLRTETAALVACHTANLLNE